MFNEKIKPSLVLTLICLITCGLLVAAYQATYKDESGIITDDMKTSLETIYSSSDSFTMIKNEDGSVYAPEGVTSVLEDTNGNVAFEITTDGYSSGGIHVLIGLDGTGAVCGVEFLSLGETPGLGTKVRDNPEYRTQFYGLVKDRLPAETEETNDVKYTYSWGTREKIDELSSQSAEPTDEFVHDAVTGATFSSKGMYRAVTIALNGYEEYKGKESAVNE